MEDNRIDPWMNTNPPIDNKEYLCKMQDGYIKMCFWNGKRWTDMWETTLDGGVTKWTLLPDELVNAKHITTNTEDYIKVAEKLYYHMNPDTKMDVPNSAYITTEKWYHEWMGENTELGLFDWCIKNKQ